VANGRAAITSRRFPPPWSVEEEEACFIVRDHNGQALTYVYFEEEPGRRAAAKLLTRDGAQDHRPAGALMSRTMFAVVVVLLNTLSFTSLAYIANRKGYHAMAALAAAGAWPFGVTGGVLIWGIWR
jgi:hypothetical protein